MIQVYCIFGIVLRQDTISTLSALSSSYRSTRFLHRYTRLFKELDQVFRKRKPGNITYSNSSALILYRYFMFQPCVAIIVRWSPLRPRIIVRSPISTGRSRQSRGKQPSRSPRKTASVKWTSTAEWQRPRQPPRQHVSGCSCVKPSNVDVCVRVALATHCRRPVNSSVGRRRAFLLMCVGSERKKSRSRNLKGNV